MKETYLEKKARTDMLEEEKNHIIFGLMGGIILVLIGGLNWLSTGQKAWEIVCIGIAALGLLFILLAIAVPVLLKYPYKAFRFFGNTMGKIIFTVILSVLYCLFIFPVGLFLRRKREAQGYFAWEQEPPKPRSMFVRTSQTIAQKTGKSSYFGIVRRLLTVFAASRKFILIPITIILVIAGLILFFVSSNVMTAFIYTLF